MSVFSEHLNDLIQRKNLTLSYLEAESGLSAALISKIKTGKRLPDSEEKMLKLLQTLHLSAQKEKELLKEYRIEKLGQEKYLCMEEIRKTLNALSHYSSPVTIPRTVSYRFEKNQFFSGENNIKSLIQYLLETEIYGSCNVLKILLQPNFTFLEDCLVQLAAGAEIKDLRLEHIIYLQEPDSDRSNYENFTLTNSCLRLASIYRTHYQVFYSYKSELPSELFPYCILTSRYGLFISADYQNALLIWETDTLASLSKMFDGILPAVRPLIHIADDAVGFLQGYAQHLWNFDTTENYSVGLSYVPCILTSVSPELAMRRINPELKKNAYVMDFLQFYFTNRDIIEDITIFSMKGLELFMETGLCYELPEGCCDAFTPEERIEIMRNFMQQAEDGQLIPILVRNELVNLSPELVITIYNCKNTTFMWHVPSLPFSSCFIQEDGIRNSLVDFSIYIQQTDDITYSRRESMAILREYMQKFA